MSAPGWYFFSTEYFAPFSLLQGCYVRKKECGYYHTP